MDSGYPTERIRSQIPSAIQTSVADYLNGRPTIEAASCASAKTRAPTPLALSKRVFFGRYRRPLRGHEISSASWASSPRGRP